ncbi:hypothetical protein EK21DRAFT_21695, partial [Setomelanomma holmii]
MLPQKPTLVRSRLLAALPTTFVLSIALASLLSPHRTSAIETPDTLAPTVLDQPLLDAASDPLASLQDDMSNDDGSGGYAPDFDYFDRSLLGRQESQEPQLRELKNDEKTEMDIAQGATAFFVLKKGQSRIVRAEDDAPEALEARAIANTPGNLVAEDIAVDHDEKDDKRDDTSDELRKRQSTNRVWLSANTCRQPMFTEGQAPQSHPQLVMYISTSNPRPGPNSTTGLATAPVLFDSGFASLDLNTSSDVYIGIAAPNLENGWFGSWHFEMTASLHGTYYTYNQSDPFLYLIDSDSDSALFITYNLSDPTNTTNTTEQWIDNNPFRMYAWPVGDNTNITGMEHSLCALKSLNNETDVTVQTTITTKFGGNLPKSQFHVQGLKNGTKYNGFLTVEGSQNVLQLPGAGAVRGGGYVFKQFEFMTKFDTSCQVIYDLEFCDSVAYAVPSSDKYKNDDDGLKALYVDQAKKYYDNFNKSIQQVACDTTSDAQYSLARNCNDCKIDYKNWLCSVLIPRCEDWQAPDAKWWLQPRNVNALLPDGSSTYNGNMSKEFNETKRDRFAFSKSRNPMIDETIQPGPYKELKPCEDLCFDIVRSCPAKLEFSCPNPPARDSSYGRRDPKEEDLWCNFPGAVQKLNVQGGVGRVDLRVGYVLMAAVLVVL